VHCGSGLDVESIGVEDVLGWHLPDLWALFDICSSATGAGSGWAWSYRAPMCQRPTVDRILKQDHDCLHELPLWAPPILKQIAVVPVSESRP